MYVPVLLTSLEMHAGMTFFLEMEAQFTSFSKKEAGLN